MGAGVRDAFPPPMCGWVGCLRVSFGQIAHERLMPFWGLRVNDYFVCMGLCGKILRSVVGAVPVCPPVSPCRGAFVVHSPCIMRVFGMETLLCIRPFRPTGGASIVKSSCTMRVFLVWKRRYADIRAGTQAPPLRFRLGGLRMDAAACRPTRTHPSFISPWFGELLCEKSCARMRCTAFFMEWVALKGKPTRGL